MINDIRKAELSFGSIFPIYWQNTTVKIRFMRFSKMPLMKTESSITFVMMVFMSFSKSSDFDTFLKNEAKNEFDQNIFSCKMTIVKGKNRTKIHVKLVFYDITRFLK